MTTALDLAKIFAHSHPTRTNGSPWAGFCAALVFMFTGAKRAYNTAYDAFLDTKIESTNAAAAPVLAVHYWKSPGDEPHPGHVGVGVLAGGAGVFMASAHADSLGTNIGVRDVDSYTQASGMVYLGWSRRYGRNAVTLTPMPADAWKTPTQLALEHAQAVAAAEKAAQEQAAKLTQVEKLQDVAKYLSRVPQWTHHPAVAAMRRGKITPSGARLVQRQAIAEGFTYQGRPYHVDRLGRVGGATQYAIDHFAALGAKL